MRICSGTPASRLRVLLVVPLLVPLAAVAADLAAPTPGASCAARAAAAIQARYDSIRDFKARFEQSTRSVALAGSRLADGEVARGHVVIAKPGKMRWVYEEPSRSTLVSDGRNLWIYDAEARELQHFQAGSGYLAGAGIQFLMGDGVLRDSFAISAPECGGETVELELRPLQPATYERLGLLAVTATGEVIATTIVDLFGNITRIAFSQMMTNVGTDPALFRFEAPPGVRVIELGALP